MSLLGGHDDPCVASAFWWPCSRRWSGVGHQFDVVGDAGPPHRQEIRLESQTIDARRDMHLFGKVLDGTTVLLRYLSSIPIADASSCRGCLGMSFGNVSLLARPARGPLLYSATVVHMTG